MDEKEVISKSTGLFQELLGNNNVSDNLKLFLEEVNLFLHFLNFLENNLWKFPENNFNYANFSFPEVRPT